MLNRKIDNEIDVHFSSSKKALCLTGARPVGKTCSIRKYAKLHVLNLIEFYFLLQPEAMDIINRAGDTKELLLPLPVCTYASVHTQGCRYTAQCYNYMSDNLADDFAIFNRCNTLIIR